MKEKKQIKKLVLGKETIAGLDEVAESKIKGAAAPACENTQTSIDPGCSNTNM